jgi:hypothetical protein
MVKVEIREARDEDLPAILPLYAQPDVDNGKVLSIEQAQKIFAQIKPKSKAIPNTGFMSQRLRTGLSERSLYLSWTTLRIWALRRESLRTW